MMTRIVLEVLNVSIDEVEVMKLFQVAMELGTRVKTTALTDKIWRLSVWSPE